MRENRTGVTKYNQGLDADSLNHTATGITRIMDASEMRVKLMARVFAETLVVPMFRGIHEMAQEYSEEEEVFKLRGTWSKVDPREWKKRDKMKVTIPLGGASRQALIAFFQQMLGVQESALKFQGGPNGPLVQMENVYNTLEQMTRLAGISSIEPFFMRPKPLDPNAPPPPPPPNPEMVKAQATAAAAQAEQASNQKAAQQQMAFEQQAATQKQQFEQAAAQQKQQFEQERQRAEWAHKAHMDEVRFNHEAKVMQAKAESEIAVARFTAEERAKVARETAAKQPAKKPE